MTPLFAKLNLKDQTDIVVLNAPPTFAPELAKLENVKVIRAVAKAKKIAFALAFVTQQREIDALAPSLIAKAEGDAVVWFIYPKQTSKKYKCDFNRDTGWAALGAAGFEAVRMVAIDEDWSALRFRNVAFIKSMTRDTTRAQTAEGKKRVAGAKGS
jgi:hypothetical protein